MPVPVWAALLAVAVAKKVVVFTAAKVRCQSLSFLEDVGWRMSAEAASCISLWCRSMASRACTDGSSSWRGY